MARQPHGGRSDDGVPALASTFGEVFFFFFLWENTIKYSSHNIKHSSFNNSIVFSWLHFAQVFKTNKR